MSRHRFPGAMLRSLACAWLALLVCGVAQAQVPSAPSSLTATAAAAGQINLGWTDNSTNETSFKIERKTGAGGTYAQIATTSSNVATYQNPGILASTTYFYRVRASNASGNSAYSNEVSATTPSKPAGLVAAYGFNDGSGTVLGDVSGSGFNGTLTNSPIWTAGKYGQALQFNASDDGNDNNDPRVVLGRTINIPNLPLTISAWVNPTNFNDYRAIISKRDTAVSSDMRLDFGLQMGDGRVYVFNGTTGGPTYLFSYSPPLSAWTHLALVADASSTRLYVNGVLQESLGVITLGTDTTANTVIGGTGEGTGGDNDPFNGKIDDLRIYSRALTQAEIQTDMNTSVGGAAPPPDTSAPTVPTGLGAAAASSAQINLSWSASTDNVGVTGYQIDRCQGAGCSTFTQIGTSATTAFANTGLTASTSYSYRVRATDAAGNVSGNSSTASATTPPPPDTTAPTAPSTISATVVSSTQINLSWSASTDNVGVTGYQIDRCQGASCSTFTQIGTSATTAFNDTALTASTSYSYRVRATDAAGNVSANSVSATAVTSAPPDTTAPTAPSTISATVVSSTQINLSWSASTDNVGVTGYQIDSCQGAACSTFTQIGTSATTTFNNTGLTASTSYSYRVRATDAAGNVSANSSTVTTTTSAPPDTAAPSAPTGVGATVASSTQINLSWTASTDNVGVTGYQIDRCQGAGCSTFAQIAAPTATSFSDTGLTAGTSYSYRVRAADAAGNLSANSSVASATTPTPPNAPSGLGATSSALTINLAWTDASTDETGFKVERKTGASGTYGQIVLAAANATSYADTGLAPGTSYFYRVRSTNANGDSAYSNEASATTLALPSAPANLNATGGPNAQTNLRWSDTSNNETGFKIERKLGIGGTYAQIATTAANVTTFDDSGLAGGGTTYFYRVRATNAAGDSAYSNEAGAATPVPDIVVNQNIVYTYDPFGNLIETNAGGVITTVDYDQRGRKTRMVDPDMGTWTYSYNALGEMIRQTDAKNQITTMVQDVLGRMTSRSEPDLVSTWTYDICVMGKGKLCQASASNGYSRSHTYDSLGRPSTTTTVIDASYTVTTTYVQSGVNVGKVDTVTYPTGFAVKYVYTANGLGYLSTVQRADAGGNTVFWTANAMSAGGMVTSELLGNGLTQTRTPDALDRLSSVVASGTPGTVQNIAYTYDTIGNVTDRVDSANGITEHFDYDKLNRLTMSSGTGPVGPLVTRSLDYDAIGNIVYKSDVGTYTYGAKPHAVTGVSGSLNASYVYDANGNLSSGAGRNVTPTSFNQPAIIAGTAATYTYTYSSEHERVRLVTQLQTGTQTSIYFHPGGGGALFYEKEIKPDSSLEHKHYVRAGALLVGVYVTKSSYASGDGPQMRYYHRDNLGSIVAISNEAGARIEGLGYEAFGKRRFLDGTADPGNNLFGITTDRGFTAHEHLDELGLIHMNGRVYDPLLGRFMTADPIIQSPGNLQSYNRYSYVWNNPLASADPSGYFNVFKKKDWAKLTEKIMEEAGRNKYLGGLMQMGLLTHPFGFGWAYGWSTGDWKTVGRAYATNTVMAASIGAGALAWEAYTAAIAGSATAGAGAAGAVAATQAGAAAGYITVSAGIGYAGTYANARINGMSDEEARHAALLSAKRSALMGIFKIGANAVYSNVTDRAPDTESGKNGGPIYLEKDDEGNPMPVPSTNVFGLNRLPDGSFLDNLTQDSPFSRFMNQFPGFNAGAIFDDSLYVKGIFSGLGWLPLTIPTAVLVTGCALWCGPQTPLPPVFVRPQDGLVSVDRALGLQN